MDVSYGLEADFPFAKLAFKNWPAAETNGSKLAPVKLTSKSASQLPDVLTELQRQCKPKRNSRLTSAELNLCKFFSVPSIVDNLLRTGAMVSFFIVVGIILLSEPTNSGSPNSVRY